jgi:hypothetical protein
MFRSFERDSLISLLLVVMLLVAPRGMGCSIPLVSETPPSTFLVPFCFVETALFLLLFFPMIILIVLITVLNVEVFVYRMMYRMILFVLISLFS